MNKIDELLEYVQRTNPNMTRDRLKEELSKSDYVSLSLFNSMEQNKK